MRNTLLLMIALAAVLGAAPLKVVTGHVKAHTEVFGDSTIDPQTDAIISHLESDGTPESLSGYVTVAVSKLVSDNADRDEHMHEAMASSDFPEAVYTFGTIAKNDTGYTVEGSLTLHGVIKPLTLEVQMTQEDNHLKMSGTGSLLMSNFGIEPPTLLFLTVRDRVDITFDLTLSQE